MIRWLAILFTIVFGVVFVLESYGDHARTHARRAGVGVRPALEQANTTALYNNGVNEYSTCADIADLEGDQIYSFSYWYKFPLVIWAANCQPLGKYTSSAATRSWDIWIGSDANFYIFLADGSGNLHGGWWDPTWDTNWHHILVQLDLTQSGDVGLGPGNKVRVWHDCVEQTLTLYGTSVPSTLRDTSASFTIVGDSWGGACPMMIDEIATWENRLLQCSDLVYNSKPRELAKQRPDHWWRFDNDTPTTMSDDGYGAHTTDCTGVNQEAEDWQTDDLP